MVIFFLIICVILVCMSIPIYLEDHRAREKRVSDILDGLRQPTWSSTPYESNCTCAWFNECPVHGIEVCPRCGENQFKDNPHRHTGFTPTERKK